MPAPDDRRARTSRSLTLRGRAVLAAGITTMACGFGLVERDIARVGVLAAVAPLLSLAHVSRKEPRFDVRREVAPPSVPVHEQVMVTLQVRNAGRDSGLLRLEDAVDPLLGDSPAFSLPSLAREGERSLRYRLEPTLRGEYALGPLAITVRDPLGLAELVHRGESTQGLLVTPPAHALPDIGLAGGWQGAGGELARAFTVGDVADATVRDYRRGDDLRRVHWPSTARTGELMVRREEQPLQSTATVVLDNRAATTDPDAFERMVEAAASACRHLVEHGYDVQLLTADRVVGAAGREAPLWTLMRELAVLAPSRAAAWPAPAAPEETGLTVVCLAGAHPERHSALRGFDTTGGQALAVLVDPDPQAAGWLRQLGWRGTTWADDESLSTAWGRLGTP